ncbi:M15 family metallopeptidase [Georgenia ruanii]|uniref:D-alanyl-D-alanine carboxypeptidase-like core domain-containing protein n=1 Tax=Georgenia ruanii TaxID=348442 RepID=A0A7J9UYI1_9MICO|nr:M15 family metallopeptidase [Georgenia ruanii]MPV89689.1 hypothetical protein [Georgenia ruanii]
MSHVSADQPVRRASARGVVLVLVVLAVVAVAVRLTTGDGVESAWATLRGSHAGQPAAATALDADLDSRFHAAQQDAASAGVELRITSGWRSARDQQRLVDEAITQYGSAEAAHRWVLPPERSAHVAGLAIDVGPATGAQWLEAHGSTYGLCRVYLNEPWHFEPLVAPGTTCPELQPDAGSALD